MGISLSDVRRHWIAGTPIDAVTVEEAAAWSWARAKQGQKTRVAGINAALTVLAASNHSYRELLNDFDLVLPDGFWAAAGASIINRSRIPHANTVPVVRALLRHGAEEGASVFLLGARPEVVSRAAELLPGLHPGIHVVGANDGYFSSEQEDDIVCKINSVTPDILLVGMSSPKKERFVHCHWPGLNVRVSVGVGGLLDLWAGETKETPEWARRIGFEWLARLSQEPGRLLGRYTITNLKFIGIVVRELFKPRGC